MRLIKQIKRMIRDYGLYADEQNVLVYQMGKVGSTSLEKSIPQSIHVHTLFNQRFGPARHNRGRLIKELTACVRRYALGKRSKIKIITPIRPLLDRNVSMFFQNVHLWILDYAKTHRVDWRAGGDFTLADVFESVFDHDFSEHWFDRELKKLTGIDVYAHAYDPAQAWVRVTQGRYELLVIDLKACEQAERVLSDFIGHEVVMERKNQAADKWYFPLYARFREEYRPSAEYQEHITHSAFQQHFYPES